MKKFIQLFVLITGILMASQAFAADVYTIDTAHSTFAFTIKHLMVSYVSGGFSQSEGNVTYDPNDMAAFEAKATIQTGSINTLNKQRDDHLKGPDFFDAAKFPTITFVTKKIVTQENRSTLVGDLTIKGVTKEVSIPVTISGPVESPMGGTVIGVNGQFFLNRQDFGISWNKSLDKGGVVLSDEVTITFSIEAKK